MSCKKLNCKRCRFRLQCTKDERSDAVCRKQGKPWEPQDDRRSAQLPDGWWEKQKSEIEDIIE